MSRIVVDANFIGRGHFNLRRLRSFLDSVVGTGVEIVVPEVVVWEWAEHAAATFDALAEQHQHFQVDPSLYGLPAMPPAQTQHDLVALILKELPREVTVWRAPLEEWKAAVEAQVLQTGTGERKDGVKTGAADHLVLACVRAQVEDRANAEAIVLATGDKNLQRVCRESLGGEVLLADSDHQLLARLVEFKPAPGELAETVEEELTNRIKSGPSDISRSLENFAMGFDIASRVQASTTTERELARLGGVDIVELHDLEVGEFDQGARVGYAQIRIFADVHMTVLTLSKRDGGELEWVQTFSGNLTGGLIDLPLNVTFDRDWNLVSVAPAGIARIDFNQSDEDEDEDEPPEAPEIRPANL